MFKIYNTKAITRQQRFKNAIVVGAAAFALFLIVWFVILNVFHVYFPLLYVAFGLGMGYAIQYFGKGVQIQFSILAAGLTLLLLLVCDLMAFGSISRLLGLFAEAGTTALFEIGYRALGLYLAFTTARVV